VRIVPNLFEIRDTIKSGLQDSIWSAIFCFLSDAVSGPWKILEFQWGLSLEGTWLAYHRCVTIENNRRYRRQPNCLYVGKLTRLQRALETIVPEYLQSHVWKLYVGQ